MHVSEVPDDFEKVLPVGVGAGSVSGLCQDGAEPGTPGSFQDRAAWLTPRKLQPPATAPTLGLIINSGFTGLECTGSGEQSESLGSQEKDGSGGEGGKV